MGRGKVMEVKFYDTVNDELLKFVVIISQSNGKWVFCKHKERDTFQQYKKNWKRTDLHEQNFLQMKAYYRIILHHVGE